MPPEGYVEPNSSNGFNYVYQYADTRGNIRLSYTDANKDGSITTDEIFEENNYYPFGLKHEKLNPLVSSLRNDVARKFKYNGVEQEEALGLDLYEMEVRSYDPAIARFTGIDPVTHHSMSTYTAFDNNPVYWSDPLGADAYNEGHGNEEGRRDSHGRAFMSEGRHISVTDRGGLSTKSTLGDGNSNESDSAESTNENSGNGTYQISRETTVSSSVTFNPLVEGDNKGEQVVETKVSVISRYYQDKKVIQVNETMIYETVISANYDIDSNTELFDKITTVFGSGGKIERTINPPLVNRDVNLSQMNDLQASIVDMTIKTSQRYNNAVPRLTKEFNIGVLNKLKAGVSISLPGGHGVFRLQGNPGAGYIADEIGKAKDSDIKAQAIYRSTKSTMLKKVGRIKL